LIGQINQPQPLPCGEVLRDDGKAALGAYVNRVALYALLLPRLGPLKGEGNARIETPLNAVVLHGGLETWRFQK